MSPEAQRIAIAEFCGWQEVGDSYWYPPSGEHAVRDCPAYLNDLNAMHEAEKLLPNEMKTEYIRALNKSDFSYRRLTFATAAQRAEALLRTTGKWHDGERVLTGQQPDSEKTETQKP